MPLIIIRNESGQDRVIEEGLEFRLRPGEKVVGSTSVIEEYQDLNAVVQESGLLFGNAVAKMTKLFGIKPCSSCDQRRKLLNRIKELGVVETVRQLKDTF